MELLRLLRYSVLMSWVHNFRMAFQLGDGGDVLGPQLVLHEVPGVLYRIPVRRIARPINDFEWLVLQEVLYPF